jgi:hypothetical protein
MLFGSRRKEKGGRELKDDSADDAPKEPLKSLVLDF